MSVNKAFVIKNSLEVNQKLILADSVTGKVGIGTSQPAYLLDVAGGIGVTDVYVRNNLYTVGVSTIIGRLSVGVGGTTLTGVGGSIGIGTTNPAYLLDVRSPVSTGQTALYVRGDVRVTGDLVIEDDLTLDEVTVRNITVSSQTSTLNLSVSGISTLNNTLNVVPTSTGIAGLFSGTTSGDMVRITQLGTGNALVVEDSTNPDATPFVINAAGNVGIGTTNPIGQLQVSSGAVIIGAATSTGTASQALQVTGGAYVSTALGIGRTNPGVYALDVNGIARIGGASGGKISVGTGMAAGEFGLQILPYSDRTELQAEQQGTSYRPLILQPFGSNVGIGTTSPTSKLTVVGDVLVSGTSTLGTLRVSSGIVTSSTVGVSVTYYGDGSNLTGIIASSGGSIGIQSGGVTVGTAITTINFVGTGLTASQSSNTSNVYLPAPGVSLGLAIALGS